MDELDFDGLFTETPNDYALGMLERLLGGIVPFLRGGADTAGANLLSEMFWFFNTAMLFIALPVLAYTIYRAFWDTTTDGTVFGNQTSSSYTVLKVLFGFIALIPTGTGYMVIQIFMIWLLIQGSYLGDTAWSRTAEASLQGRSLLAPPSVLTMDDYVVQEEFADAFDALVLGHLCAFNANDIKLTLDGDAEADRRAGPMTLRVVAPEPEEITGFFAALDGTERVELQHAMFFSEDADSNAYSGRNNFCGGVERRQTLVVGGDDYSSFRDGVINTQKLTRFNSYIEVMGDLAGEARDLAWSIYNDERRVRVIGADTRSAVTSATRDYITGIASTNTVSSAELDAIQEELLERAVEFGWAFAPSWQRGIAMAGSAQGNALADFEIEATRQSEIDDYLSRGERRSDIGRSMLALAEDDENTWDLMEATVRNLGEPGAADEFNPLASGDDTDGAGIVNRVYRTLLSWFSVGGSPGEETSIYTDPMVDITNYGQNLMLAGGGLIAAGYGTEVAVSVASKGIVSGEAAGGFFKTIGWAFFLAGFVTSTIIPLIPFVYFYSAVLSWFLLVVEAMFAVPLAVLALFAPAQAGSPLIGPWNKVILSLFGIFMRPIFTIVGLIFSMMVISVSLGFLYDLFYGMMSFMSPGGSWWDIISLFGFVAVFLLVTLYTVLLGSSLITELGDGAMNWLDSRLSSIGQRMNAGAAVADNANLVGRTAGLPGTANVGRVATGGTIMGGVNSGRKNIGRIAERYGSGGGSASRGSLPKPN